MIDFSLPPPAIIIPAPKLIVPDYPKLVVPALGGSFAALLQAKKAGGCGPVPIVKGSGGGAQTVAGGSTSHSIAIPGVRASGDVLVACACHGSNSTSSWPAGWTSFLGTDNRISGAWRRSDGTETTVVMTTQQDEVAYFILVVGCVSVAATPIAGGFASGSGATADPPLLTPSWTTVPTLYIAVGVSIAVPSSVTGTPTGYTAGATFSDTSGANTPTIRWCQKDVNPGAAENPSAYTCTSGNNRSATIGIRGLP